MSKIRAIPLRNVSREQWLEFRRLGLGGSDMGAVLGLNDWRSPVEVYLDKTGQGEEMPDNLAMWLGRELEAPVAGKYAEETGNQVCNYDYMLHDPEYRLVGNVDRLVIPEGAKVAHKPGGEITTPLGLEIKTSGAVLWDGEIPQSYIAQVHTYMALAPRLEAIDIFVLFRGNPVATELHTETRDDTVADFIRDQAKHFWERHVLERSPPEPTSEQDCRKLWSRSKGLPLKADADAIKAVRALRDVRARAKELEAEEEALRAQIMATLGEFSDLQDAGGKNLVTWRQSKDREIIDWKAIAHELGATPNQIESHTTTRPGSRVFRVNN